MPNGIEVFLAEKVAGVTIATWITTALIVHGAVESRKARSAWTDALNNSNKVDYRDHTVTIRSTDAPRTLVYGRARVGGLFTYG